ncbi:cytochrome d ubiquinol oxidase subunit II [Acetobacteraceae bacterium]|nr:cytochrome d ubiquinol oxidase subunit II [Acetobacteraceae bacterium]
MIAGFSVYVACKLIWGFLLAVLLTMIGLMVGMDMGVGTMLNFVGRDNDERRTLLAMIGPHWEGNQTWFILGGGAIFAAFPTLYGTSFSALYVVMILLLFLMILRPVAFEYRGLVESNFGRTCWDWAFFLSGFGPMMIFGMAIGNILEGIGYHFIWDGQYIQDESFFAYIFNPFALLCGLMSVAMSIQQGASIIMVDGVGILYKRAQAWGVFAGPVAAVLFLVGGFYVSKMTGFNMVSADPAMASYPLIGQHAEMVRGAWLGNYSAHPILWIFPALGLLAILAQSALIKLEKAGLAWWTGLVAWAGVIGTVGSAMFPFLMPSYKNPDQSLTLWNSVGSEYGLTCMVLLAGVFIPVILAYTAWCYWAMRGKVTINDVIQNDHGY